MRARRSAAVLTAVGTFALMVTAVGGPAPASATTTAKAPYTIALSTFFEGNSYQAENVQLFLTGCKSQPKLIKKCFAENGNGSVSTQIAQLEGLINEHVSERCRAESH
jgi:ABC-type sugar transport system substrate-binding protein